jgi:hypothetical protein
MKKYKKKPVVIEAIQFDGSQEAAEKMIETMGKGSCEPHGELTRLLIPTLEGDMWAHKGDYVIKGIKGEYYPCREDIFLATYDAAK